MWYGLIGLVVGVGLGFVVPLTLPPTSLRYVAVLCLVVLDALFGAAKADLQGRYETSIFLSGLLINLALAAGLVYIGDSLGVDLMVAVLVVLVWRMFANAAKIRYGFLRHRLGHRRTEEAIEE